LTGNGFPDFSLSFFMRPLRPHPHLYEMNTWVWLNELSRKAGKITRLGDVSEQEWDRLRSLGFDCVWLMGIWERSPRSRQIARTDAGLRRAYDHALPGWREPDVVGSPYAIRAYRPDPALASWENLRRTREALHDRGMKLILDFVPNHTALDHEWVESHPEYYVQGSREEVGARPADFFAVHVGSATLHLAHGKDPYFPPWTDTAQLNLFHSDTRKALYGELEKMAEYCDGVRCDMAMLVLNEVFAGTWKGCLQSDSPPKEEFWAEACRLLPDFIWIAEVYWDLEWKLQRLGITYTYDKRLYDRLRGPAPSCIMDHLRADGEFQRRLVRFIENHDEERAMTAFGPRQHAAVAIVMATLPGMRLYHQGQLEGRRIRIPVQLARRMEESVDHRVEGWYVRLLHVTDDDVFHAGQWRLLVVRSSGDSSYEQLLAYEWKLESKHVVVIVNLGTIPARGSIVLMEDAFVPPQVRTEDFWVFDDPIHHFRLKRKVGELIEQGLHLEVPPYQGHILLRKLTCARAGEGVEGAG
jgi:hypothetical protein